MMSGNTTASNLAVIENLFRTADIAMPTPQRCIAPVGDLVSNFNLTCTELPKLTQSRAMQHLLQQGGILEIPDEQGREPLAGFLYVNTHFGSIFVEQTDLLVRRRFSVAHELGHYLLHFRPLLEAAEGDDEYLEISESLKLSEEEIDPQNETSGCVLLPKATRKDYQLPPFIQMEREANQFAAELLMPAEVVRGVLARYITYLKGDDLIWRLATEMLVSSESMRWRLHNLGLLAGQDQHFSE